MPRIILYLLIGGILGSILFSLIFFFLFDNPKPDLETEQAWQQSFREVLVNGYFNFKGHYVNADAAVYIFSYQFPSKLSSKEIFSSLRKQLKGYNSVSESKDELVLRRYGTILGNEGFDEYRFLIDEQHKKITVMFASLYSPVEIKNHPFFIKKLQKAHHADR